MLSFDATLVPDSIRYTDNKAYYQYLLDKKYRPRGETGDLKRLSLDDVEEEEEEEGKAEEDMDEDDLRKVHPDIRQYRALCRGDEGVVKVCPSRATTLLRGCFTNILSRT